MVPRPYRSRQPCRHHPRTTSASRVSRGNAPTGLIKLMASLAAPTAGGWTRGLCSGDYGRKAVAYHDDGRGLTTALLTAYGEVIPTSRVALGWPQPERPRA